MQIMATTDQIKPNVLHLLKTYEKNLYVNLVDINTYLTF